MPKKQTTEEPEENNQVFADGQMIRIGMLDYEIQYGQICSTEDGRIEGQIVYADQQIFLRYGNQPRYQFQTLIHECVHGILGQAGWNSVLDEDQNEGLVTALGFGLANLLIHNPVLGIKAKELLDERLESDRQHGSVAPDDAE